ncbi:hypothetical protein B0H14DRAFT_2654795 [Mycena olivaceomarginata]|nr:hypothetical protein B0H14DRAFT_2654795 [Mycena olivaceomarginata]
MVDMPVTEFLAVQLASSVLAVYEPCLKRTSSWFRLQPPDCGEDVVWLLRSIPPLEFILQLLADHPQAWLNGFASIVDHTNRTRHLPLWTVTFFHEILTIKLAQDKWRESHYWLPDSEKFILDYTSWNTRHSGALESQLDWTRLISDEWLSDGIIDEMMRDIKARVSEDQSLASSTIIRPLLFQFYITQLGVHGTQPKRYLAEILAEVKSGKTRMLFPIHYNGNHWMAFIINFEHRTFGFASLPMTSIMYSAPFQVKPTTPFVKWDTLLTCYACFCPYRRSGAQQMEEAAQRQGQGPDPNDTNQENSPRGLSPTPLPRPATAGPSALTRTGSSSSTSARTPTTSLPFCPSTGKEGRGRAGVYDVGCVPSLFL